MTGLQLVTGPTVEPVSIAELKATIHVDDDIIDDDGVLIANLYAVRTILEEHLDRALITQTWRMFLDVPPAGELPWWDGVREGADIPRIQRAIILPKAPLQSVSSINSYNDADAATLFAAANYFVDTVTDPGKIVLRTSATWPTVERVANGLEINFVAGYGDGWNDVPMPIRTALIEMVRVVYDQCEGDGGKMTAAMIPDSAKRFLQPYEHKRLMAGLGE